MKSLPSLAFVDLETTGTTPTGDRITEVAIVTWDKGQVSRWSQLVNPECRLPPFITQLTGISDAMLAAAPRFAEIADEILARLEGHLFVAHNARFDYGFLKNEFKRIDRPFRGPVLCTVRLSRALFPEERHHDLDSLIRRHGLTVTARHRALGDAQAICDFWSLAVSRFGESHLLETVRALVGRRSQPLHLPLEAIEELPDICGVYLFYGQHHGEGYGKHDLPLYVGKSRHIRQRVMAHFAADHAGAKEMSIAQQVHRIEWIACAGEIEALLTEARLVKELQPILNLQLRRHQRPCAWLLADQGFGLWQPRLVDDRDLDLGRHADLYGLFTNRRSARATLEFIIKEQGLCRALLGLEKVAPGKPCFARQVRRCRGACIGEESHVEHSRRLTEALTPLAVVAWPFAGPAVLEEGAARHLIDAWRYLGTAVSAADLATLQGAVRPAFDRDTYRILVKHRDQLRPIDRSLAWTPDS